MGTSKSHLLKLKENEHAWDNFEINLIMYIYMLHTVMTANPSKIQIQRYFICSLFSRVCEKFKELTCNLPS